MEQKKIDRAFAQRYVPIVYQTALERVHDQAIAKLVSKRVFAKVQEAMGRNAMPAELAMEAWLVFLTQDETAGMIRQMPALAHAAQKPVPASTPANAVQPSPTPIPPAAQRITPRAAAEAPSNAVPPAAPERKARGNAVERDTDTRFHPQKRPASAFLIVLFVLLAIVNLWFIVGLLCARGILPKVDLGYSWFDAVIIELFCL